MGRETPEAAFASWRSYQENQRRIAKAKEWHLKNGAKEADLYQVVRFEGRLVRVFTADLEPWRDKKKC